ncbi:MAG: primosomal protein N' [Eubacterium sp.]|nr:primosomal protein N' [Eubacterium sp.]MBR0413323.1 primosomal protein N' [Eubacterium sp.]
MNNLIAEIAVDKTFFSFDTDYSYAVPAEFADKIEVGYDVKVPFGAGNVLRSGIVVALKNGNTDKLKFIHSIDKKVLIDEMVSLALWLRERCFCTTYDCLKQMLPRGYGKFKGKSERMVRLVDDSEDVLLGVTKKQKTVCDLLLDVGSASANEVCEFCSVGMTVLKNLEKNGIVEFYKREVLTTPYADVTEGEQTPIELSAEQQNAYSTYANMMQNGGGTGLLYGVTGSGKTQVYLKLIDDAINSGKDAIVLVPEISLTPQTLAIFHKRYGSKCAVIHSGLSIGERNDEYKRADRGDAKIVIGTRSAIFAPLHNLGLIIMDEEQEHTYKSERTPRYNTKDVARFRAGYNKALFLMTSATPSIEAYSNAKKGKYVLCELSERYGDADLPDVITVDMKREARNGNKTPLSATLKNLIQENLDSGKQTILLINRRGYNTFIACNKCGHIVMCPNCSISLTYHSYNNRLVCHYCGFTKPLDNICPECGSDSVRYSGFGTQRIEDELYKAFPTARIVRMDADTTTTKFSHQKILDAFAAGDYDILIGTQMVAKGLDFDNVTLVGVVNADNSLYDESYTASEKSFDLITQVVGRAGRRNVKGKAVIQTINPYNDTIIYASDQDYKGFYESEIEMRRLMIYPPYCDLISVSFTSEDENKTALCAKAFFDELVRLNKEKYSEVKLVVLGPTPSKISKINNHFRYRLALKCKNSENVRSMVTEILKIITKNKEYKQVSISVDINPNDIS